MALLIVMLLALSVSVTHAALTDGLIGHWQFDEDGSDSSGFGRDLRLINTTTTSTGEGLFGSEALDLRGNVVGPDLDNQFAVRNSGTGAYNVADDIDDADFNFLPASAGGTDGFTVQAWVWLSQPTVNTRENSTIEKWHEGGGPGWTTAIFSPGAGDDAGGPNSSGNWRNFMNGDACCPSSGAFALDGSAAWHHVVLRGQYNASEELLFANAADGNVSQPLVNLGTALMGSNGKGLRIGQRQGGQPFVLDGMVDEVAIWNRFLDDAEIEQLWNNGEGLEMSGGGTPVTEVTWTNDASGDFNAARNWQPSRVPDSSLGGTNADITTAVFGDVITAPQTVYTNSDVSVTQVTFLNANKYAIVGTGSVNFVTNSMAPKIDVFVGDHEFQTDVNVGSEMSVTVGAGTSLTFDNSLNLNGNTLTKFGPGTLNINNNVVASAGGTIDCQGGNCAGSGTIGGNLSNNSLVSPGNSPGILSVDGNFTQSAGGTLEIELASNGGVAGTDHDRLAVTLAASLDGTLDLQLDGGYSPTIGDSFAGIVTAGTVSGNFATTNNVVIDGRRGVAVTYTETAVNAQIGLRGNTDIAAGDIDVDTSDLTTSIINFTSAGGIGKTWADGDMDGDGDVDTSDLTTSIINFTSALSSGSAAVPEPSAVVLLTLGMCLLVVRRQVQ